MKEGLINYLRHNLQYSNIKLRGALIISELNNSKPYTAREKFQYLAAKNPSLQLLKEQLSLDIID